MDMSEWLSLSCRGKRFYTASISENYFEAKKTKELGDIRFELCNKCTQQIKVRGSDEDFLLGDRSDVVLCFVVVSVQNIIHVLSNDTLRVTIT